MAFRSLKLIILIFSPGIKDMEFYFDILPDDLTFMIIRKCERKWILSELGNSCLEAYTKYKNLLQTGNIEPDIKLCETGWHDPDYNEVEINSKKVDHVEFRLILDELIGGDQKKTCYYFNSMYDYDGYLNIIYKTNFSDNLIGVLQRNSIDTTKISDKSNVYVKYAADWNSIFGRTTIEFDCNWKHFWNMILNAGDRRIILKNNLE